MLKLPILAALILVAPLAAQTIDIQPAGGAKATETRTVDLAPGAPLKVHNVNGYLHVVGWDQNKVEFTGAFTPGKNKEQVKVVIRPKGGGLDIDAIYPKGNSDGRACDMDLKVPRSALASLETVNGDLTLKDVAGKAEVRTVNGAIAVEGVPGAVRAETVNGSIKGKDLGGTVDAKTVNGAITLTSKGLRGHLKASTVNGSLRIKGEGARDIEAGRRHMEATFGTGGGELRLSTVNGDILLD